MTEMSDETLRRITEKVFQDRAIDFRDYKPSTLRRRIQRRMEAAHCASAADYLELLDSRPEEYSELINSLLINVTEFFRDPAAWDVIRGEVIPRILAGKRKGDQIKVWSAGCATGEEPYTLAMLFAEAIGDRKKGIEVRIYATDIDDRALVVARRGVYSDKALEPVPKELRDKYFSKDRPWVVSRELRKTVIFGRHNLVTDAPISHCDLIVCRNVLIYMTVNLQNQLLSKFHYALETPGFMFLGKAEAMLALSRLFSSVNEKVHIFAKESPGGAAARARADQRALGAAVEAGAEEYHLIGLFNEAVLRHAPVGVIAVDGNNIVRLMNPASERLWGIRSRDLLGRSLVEVSIPASLQGLVQQATQVRHDKRELTIDEVPITTDRGRESCVSVKITPMFDVRGNAGGVIILAEDITAQSGLRREIEAVNEELNATNEELETTNEELQSTNEELVTTNEELQATNEELETTNEELQSSNEELETTNDELEARTHELNRTKDEIEARSEALESLNKALGKESAERSAAEEALARVYDREHRIAETLQQALIPVTPPTVTGLRLDTRYRAGSDEAEVGGDFFNLSRIGENHLVIALGDVSGKGLESAVFGYMAKYMLLGFAGETPEPGMVMNRLNEALCAQSMEGKFVTLAYLLVDLKTFQARWASAGHEPAIHISAATGEVTLFGSTGQPLGIEPGVRYTSRVIELARRDILFIYTDGLSEAGPREAMLGAEGLASLLQEHAGKAPPKIHDAIYQTATRISHGKLTDDAASVLVVRS